MIKSQSKTIPARFNLTAILAGAFIIFLAGTGTAQNKENNKNKAMSSFSDYGQPAPKEHFTGTVLVNMNVTPDDGYNANAGTVTFAPKARTNWHSHKSGQVLFVIEGVGYYQEQGKPVQLMQKGDVIKIPKNARHWHGASHSSFMRHIALITDHDKDKTEWYKPVTDEQYNSYAAPDTKILTEITQHAATNHEVLWPGYASKLAETDPELIVVFNNFAFDEVIGHDSLATKTRVMVILAATIGSQALTEYKVFVNAALNAGLTPVQVKEVVYQAVPYVGIAKVIDFVNATNDIFTERGIKLPLEGQSVTTPETRFEKGLAKQKEIVGGERIEAMYKDAPEDLQHIQRYLSDNCFGDYVTRNGLDVKQRELLTLSFLIALGGTETQIKGHVQGNANVGNNRQTLINVITQLLPYVGYPRTLNAINCLNEVLPPTKK